MFRISLKCSIEQDSPILFLVFWYKEELPRPDLFQNGAMCTFQGFMRVFIPIYESVHPNT
jgi:hypothetical protein